MAARTGARFWRADWHLSFLLGLLLVAVFVLYPLSDQGSVPRILLHSVLSLILISGASLAARRRVVTPLALLLIVGTAAIEWIRLYGRGEKLTDLGVSLWIVFFAMLAAMVLVRVFSEGRVNLHRIQGAIAAYLLLGVVWAFCYRLVIQLDHEAFNISASVPDDALTAKLVYFSFVTLTTLGYGDVTAVHPAARSLAVLEALTGQLFVAVLIARLVALEVSHREMS